MELILTGGKKGLLEESKPEQRFEGSIGGQRKATLDMGKIMNKKARSSLVGSEKPQMRDMRLAHALASTANRTTGEEAATNPKGNNTDCTNST